MIQLDQYKAQNVLEKALDPSTAVVDGRTEEDFLRFMSDFGSLINFFDQNNQIYGDWRPLMLKDPIILLAYISTTKYDKKHNLLLEIATKKEQIDEGLIEDSELTAMANALLDLYVDVYRDIEQWTYYMKRYEHEHHLRKYLFDEVKKEYAPLLWSLLQLRAFLHGSDLIKDVKSPRYYLFEEFDPKVWNDSVNTESFWQTLGIEYPLQNNTITTVFDSLLSNGDNLLGFYKNCIDDATNQFASLTEVENRYPDTVLVRVFAKIFQAYTGAMNGLSQEHLEFYFRDILKQKEKYASPDQVFVSIPLNSKTDPFNMPKGTQFKAGLNSDKQQILFETVRSTSLNPAKLGTAITLFCTDGKIKETRALYQNDIATPAKLMKDEKGKVLSWPSFGEKTELSEQKTLAMSIASPMFLMEDGVRTMKLTLSFQEKTNPWSILHAKFFLSTTKSWLEVTDMMSFPGFDETQLTDSPDELKSVLTLAITFNIDSTQPAIQPFKKNPDGYSTKWPLLKIEFTDFANLESPPRIKTLDVEVSASDMKSLILENDHGKLSAKKPFEPLGPAPNLNANFFLGSAEIFSKPFDQIAIEMNWDALPTDFKDYYEAYNKYLKHYDIMDGTGSKKRSFIVRWLERLFGWLFKWNIGAFQYSNKSFLVEFGILQDGDWSPLDVESVDHGELTYKKPTRRELRLERRALRRAKHGLYLFKEKLIGLNPTTWFKCPDPPEKFAPKPELQEQPLKFSETTADGFMKMTLVNPGFGFGLDLYGKVVSYLALVNAKTLISQISILGSIFSNKKIKPAANKPFNPKLKTMFVSYDAKQSYDLSIPKVEDKVESDPYPIQCFHYTPFATFKSFDNSLNINEQCSITNFTLSSPLPDETPEGDSETPRTGKEKEALPIHIPFQHDGACFMEYENLVGNAELNLFFELRRKIGVPNTTASIEYSALTDKGWEKTPVILDETQDFICSGILDLNIPMDVSSETAFMPQKKFWVSIGVDEEIDTFPETIYLNANGVRLQRCSSEFLLDSTPPKIAASAVTTPATPIPQLGAIVQPFPSFGGKKAEDENGMFKRVSSYLSTKGRANRQTDYYRIVKENFPEIYYAKVVYDRILETTKILLVRQIDDVTETSAYLPLVSECTEVRIQEFLAPRASAFSNIESTNFNPVYVTIQGTIVIDSGIAVNGIRKEIDSRINLFLSPWIKSDQSQIQIDSGISEAQVSSMILDIEGVLEVNDISFILSNEILSVSTTSTVEKHTLIQTSDATELFVPGIEHKLKFRAG